jgi:hypothetical protein
MDRDMATKPKTLREEKKEEIAKVEEKKKEKEEYELKNATKIRK